MGASMTNDPASTWLPAPAPLDEHERLRRLLRLGIGEGQHHEFLDTITSLAASIVKSPISVVSLVEENRQFFLSRHGLAVDSTGRAESFCGHCVTSQSALVVSDAHRDPRFATNPLVTNAPHVRAYLGVPLFAGPAQSAIGTLCVIDQNARTWTTEQQAAIARLGVLVENYLEGLTFRRAWDDAPLALVVLDAEGRCLRANNAFARIVGRPLHGLVEQPLASCVLPADRQVLQAMLRHAATNRESPTRRELRFVRLSGEVVSGGTSMSPLLEVDGQVICIIRDITLERRAAARSGVIAEVRRELGDPIARARALAQTARTTATPEAAAALDGVDAILGEFGELLDSRMGDISARARVETELHASEQRLRSIVEHVLGSLIVLDDRGRIVDANTTALHELGWKYDQLVGSSMRVVHPSFSDAACRHWFEIAEKRAAPDVQRADGEATFVRRDGSALQVELRLMTMDWNGPGRLVLIARDVTAAVAREAVLVQERDDLESQVKTGILALSELQRIEGALKGSLEEKETLLKEIHHRVKNNLQMVSSLLTLQMDQMPDERSRDLLAESVRRVRSMALIHQHLYGSVSLERINLGAYATNLAETLRMTLSPSARLRFVAPGDEHVEVAVDRAMPVCLILNELLTNALKYGVADGNRSVADWDVSVELTALIRSARLVVRDRGPGLPPDFTLSDHPSLGLQLVTTLTKQLRGKFSARSDDGAIFEVEFPLA
jgi:PAS domain S-box-containing protein